MALITRALKLADLERVDEIQRATPSGAQWNPADYLGYRTIVAELDGLLAGFLAVLELPGEEAEILNLAVDPTFQRRGIATRLLAELSQPTLYLDVRASNEPALAFYRRHGFSKCGHRRRYYSQPVEDAVMMKRVGIRQK